MKKVLVCASLIALSASAFASDSGLYVRGDLGASKMKLSEKVTSTDKTTMKAKPVYNLGVGYKFNDNLRSDINFQSRTASDKDLTNVTVKNKAIFLNGYYDFKNDSIFTPYVTAGIGASKNKLSHLPTGFTSKPSTSFAWNTGLGSKINVAKNVDLDVSYKFSHLGNFEGTNASNEKIKMNSKAHEVMAGVIYNF
jgi:opacity protein-like surface antigen